MMALIRNIVCVGAMTAVGIEPVPVFGEADQVPKELRRQTTRAIGPMDTGSVAASNAFDTEIKITASDAASNDRFGRRVAIDLDTVVVGALAGDGITADTGAVYIFERNEGGTNNWGEVAKLTASDGAADDQFFSVSISGDTVIVGARLDDDNGPNSGSAYIFERNEGGTDNWGEVAKLIASDATSSDAFGQSVSISGDTAIVGASNGDGITAGTGAVYIFERNEGGTNNWGQVAKMFASDGATAEAFGFAVCIDGDTAIVGARDDDDNGAQSGSAYVFERDHGGTDNWGQVAKLTASDGAAGDFFGVDVAINVDTAVVGGHRHDAFDIDDGAAYVFGRNQGGAENWGEVKKVTASDGAFDDQFGFAALSGDTLLVGARVGDGNVADSGAAYLFVRDEGGPENWGQVAKIFASDGSATDGFGGPVAIDGDTAVVGAGNNDQNGADSGSAYVYVTTPAGDKDDCATAAVVSDGALTGQSNVGATLDGPANMDTEFGPAPVDSDVWYHYTASCTGTATAGLCDAATNFDAVIGVYQDGNDPTACACPTPDQAGEDMQITGNDEGCSPDPIGAGGIVEWEVTQGDCYTLRVAGFSSGSGNEQGDFTLDVSCTPLPDAPDPLATCPNDFESASNGMGGERLSRFGCVAAPQPPSAAGGLDSAVRVTLHTMYNIASGNLDGASLCPANRTRAGLDQFEGQIRYLGQPVEYVDEGSPPQPNYLAAPLVCAPTEAAVRDWSPAGLEATFGTDADTTRIYFYGPAVAPCSIYAVEHCADPAEPATCSDPTLIHTATLADVWAPFALVNVTDITKLVDKFRGVAYVPGPPPAGAPTEPRAMLRDNVVATVGKVLNVNDITNGIDAFRGFPYKEQGPCDPGGTDECGNPCDPTPGD